MEFYYDAVIGLQYYFSLEPNISMDLEMIPSIYSPQEILEMYFQRGIVLSTATPSIEEVHQIIWNYGICDMPELVTTNTATDEIINALNYD